MADGSGRSSSEGGDARKCSCCTSDTDGSKEAPNEGFFSSSSLSLSSSWTALEGWWKVEALFLDVDLDEVSILSCFKFWPDSRRLRTVDRREPLVLGGRGNAVLGGGAGGGWSVRTVLAAEGGPADIFCENREPSASSATVEREVPAVVRSDI